MMTKKIADRLQETEANKKWLRFKPLGDDDDTAGAGTATDSTNGVAASFAASKSETVFVTSTPASSTASLLSLSAMVVAISCDDNSNLVGVRVSL